MKKLLTILLALILSISVFSLVGCAPENEPEYAEVYSYDDSYHWRAQLNGDGYAEYEAHVNEKGRCKCGKYYECKELLYSNNGGYLTCLGDGDKGTFLTYKHIEVPSYATYEGKTYPVVAIERQAFDCELIESVKLNEGLLKIGGEAFARTTKLKELIVPDSVTSYGTSMMWQAMGLEKFVFGNGCKKVPGYMFYNCSNLKEVIINQGCEEIGVVAFTNNDKLPYVVIPQSVTLIRGANVPPHYDFGAAFNCKNTYFYLEHEAPLEGFHSGYNACGKVRFKSEWAYDENGIPYEL